MYDSVTLDSRCLTSVSPSRGRAQQGRGRSPRGPSGAAALPGAARHETADPKPLSGRSPRAGEPRGARGPTAVVACTPLTPRPLSLLHAALRVSGDAAAADSLPASVSNTCFLDRDSDARGSPLRPHWPPERRWETKRRTSVSSVCDARMCAPRTRAQTCPGARVPHTRIQETSAQQNRSLPLVSAVWGRWLPSPLVTMTTALGRQEAPDHRPLVTLCRVDRAGVQGLTTPRRVAPPSVCGGNRAFVGLKLCVFLAV